MTAPSRSRILPAALVLFLLAPAASIAQDEATTTTFTQLWADYHLHYYRNRTIEYYGDGGVRFLTDEWSWAQGYIRPSVRFHNFKRFDVHLGVGAFYTYNEGASDVLEVRPWEGVRVLWPTVGPLTLSNYVRFEQRFSGDTGDQDISLALRLRYKLGTRIPIKQAFHHDDIDPLYIPISAELFFDVGDKIDQLFRDQARFDVGLGYVYNNDWVAEFHFIVQGSTSGVTQEFDTTTYIFRFQIKHLLSARDYRKTQKDLPTE